MRTLTLLEAEWRKRVGVERFNLSKTRKLLQNQQTLLIKTLTSANSNMEFSTGYRYKTKAGSAQIRISTGTNTIGREKAKSGRRLGSTLTKPSQCTSRKRTVSGNRPYHAVFLCSIAGGPLSDIQQFRDGGSVQKARGIIGTWATPLDAHTPDAHRICPRRPFILCSRLPTVSHTRSRTGLEPSSPEISHLP